MNFYNRLKILNESSILLEYNRKDLRNFVGDDYANKFFTLRDKLQAPENDLGHWVKKGDPEALKTFINDWESGATKSKSQQKKDDKMAGAELIFNDKGWKIYHITDYNAAKQLGSGTTWCITGRYNGYESKGSYYFNTYEKDYKLDGYYFMFDTLNKDPKTGDYLKYCIGITKDNRLAFMYNGLQDREISYTGIPNIPPERQVQPFADKGVTIKYHNMFTIEDNVVVSMDKNDKQSETTAVVPKGVVAIGKFVFSEAYVKTVVLPDSIKGIGKGAFLSCPRLDTINLPEGLETLGNGVFCDCKSLDMIELPESLKVIPDKAFGFCDNLVSVLLPSGIEQISDSAFLGIDNGDGAVMLGNCNEYAVEYVKKHKINYGTIDGSVMIYDPELGEYKEDN